MVLAPRARANSRPLAFATAFLTYSAGLSLALGAFLAGLLISESEYSQQALGNVKERAEERLDDWEARVFGEETEDQDRSRDQSRKEHHDRAQTERPRPHPGGYPRQVVEDLALFDLAPPSSLTEVKRARNREMKTFHSDRFVNDPAKFQTSKEIMQIYNAAYDRLRTFYESRSG